MTTLRLREKNLALEQADVNQARRLPDRQLGYLNSFNALAQLAGQALASHFSAAPQSLV